MVSTYIDRAAEILQEINKLAAFIQEMSDKFDCLYPLDEEDVYLLLGSD